MPALFLSKPRHIESPVAADALFRPLRPHSPTGTPRRLPKEGRRQFFVEYSAWSFCPTFHELVDGGLSNTAVKGDCGDLSGQHFREPEPANQTSLSISVEKWACPARKPAQTWVAETEIVAFFGCP